MTEAYVDHLSFALGDDTSSVDSAAQQGRLITDPSTLKEVGFKQHHVCHPRTSAYQLARAAVQQLQPHFTDVGALVYSTCLPLNGNLGSQQDFERSKDIKDLMNFPMNHLQVDFGLTNATAFGLNQQSSTGILGSIRLAKALLSSEADLRQVLCVTSDRLPDGAAYQQSDYLISDGAAACLVSAKPSGFRIIECFSKITGTNESVENGNGFVSNAHTCIQNLLQKAKTSISDLKWIIPQNTSTKYWKTLCSLLHFDLQNVYFPSLSQVAHVIGGDTIINLLCLIQEHKVQPGDKILLFTSSQGVTWQCILLERI